MESQFANSMTLPTDFAVARSVWFLVGQLGQDGNSIEVPIRCSPFSIGRSSEANLCLPFRTVSSQHAQIVQEGEHLVLQDLGSTNGTFVNGERIKTEIQLGPDNLIQFADVALRLRNQAPNKLSHTLQEDVYDQALALVQFDRLMNERMVIPNYQPIVRMDSEKTIAYEVLARSPLYGVETPGAMFRAAAKLNLEVQLSRMLRCEGIRHSRAFSVPPHLFVNTHPAEMSEAGLAESLQAIREVNPSQPLTLEIHESAASDLARMTELKSVLTDLDIRLAYDDFGSGQARLVELIEVRPDYLKFDMSLIRNIHCASPQRQQMVASLVRMVHELGVTPLAEGVETVEEHVACRQFGFELGQGYYYGKPAPAVAYY